MLKESKLILISLGIFSCSFLFGFIYAYALSDNHPLILIGEFRPPLRSDTTNLLNVILISNLKVLFLLIIPTFGFHTTLNLFYNGISNGIVLGSSIRKFSDATFVLILTLPHGILEIPAVIIAGAAGFKIPYEI
ncbi:MAG: stage II sporulation protein M [Archaeoglobaceae archaeon]